MRQLRPTRLMNTKLIAIILMMLGIWTSAAAADLNALDKIDVMTLVVSHVRGDRLGRLVSKRGISFHPSAEYVAALKSAGATDDVIELLNKASNNQPPPAEPATASKDSASRSAENHNTMPEDTAISYLVHASQMDEQGKEVDALKDFQKVLEAFPQNAFLHFGLGKLLPFKGEDGWDKGIREEREAARLAPDLAEAHFWLGGAYRHKGNDRAGADEYREATRIDPDWTLAHFQLGSTLEALHDLPGAVSEYRRVVQLSPDAEYAHNMLASVLIATGDFRGAIAQAQESARLKPDDPSPHGLWGRALRESGDEKGAEEQTKIYQELASRKPLPDRIRVGGQVMAPKLVHKVPPKYPKEAKDAHIQGAVKLEVVVGKDGSIQELKVISGDPALIQAAASAVRKWRYQPTTLNGHAVEVVTEIVVNFTLSN